MVLGSIDAPTLAARQTAGVFDVRGFGATGDGRRSTATRSTARSTRPPRPAAARWCSRPARYELLDPAAEPRRRCSSSTAPCSSPPTRARAAATSPPSRGRATPFQDFGHSHWHNSLIWGETSRTSPSRARADRRQGSGARRPGARFSRARAGDRPLSMGAAAGRAERSRGHRLRQRARATRRSRSSAARNVLLRDFTILRGGHMSRSSRPAWTTSRSTTSRSTPTATASTSTRCRNVRISNASVNAPNDDAIVPQELLRARRSARDGERHDHEQHGQRLRRRHDARRHLRTNARSRAPDRDGPTGRIKLGTESNGAFQQHHDLQRRVRPIARARARDGGRRACSRTSPSRTSRCARSSNAPIFLRLASRMRGPAGTPRRCAAARCSISNVIVVRRRSALCRR